VSSFLAFFAPKPDQTTWLSKSQRFFAEAKSFSIELASMIVFLYWVYQLVRHEIGF